MTRLLDRFSSIKDGAQPLRPHKWLALACLLIPTIAFAADPDIKLTGPASANVKEEIRITLDGVQIPSGDEEEAWAEKLEVTANLPDGKSDKEAVQAEISRGIGKAGKRLRIYFSGDKPGAYVIALWEGNSRNLLMHRVTVGGAVVVNPPVGPVVPPVTPPVVVNPPVTPPVNPPVTPPVNPSRSLQVMVVWESGENQSVELSSLIAAFQLETGKGFQYLKQRGHKTFLAVDDDLKNERGQPSAILKPYLTELQRRSQGTLAPLPLPCILVIDSSGGVLYGGEIPKDANPVDQVINIVKQCEVGT